ncbi:4-hydroxybenzoate octaprenyltransferase [Terricaulis silvestris]|uniref:4-hydroxybenzoate octaprenyltransferase n=1 Tax=Terricaulis silvestris TaxID=2686094 RepID=A0A6I6MHU0_9CAUL|nr:4-hydroxybenzoate octaprenyltransferase [Terricaulis silvestris]QGZ94510.1 4-hydroxybenzoate octaprenyltransferase [Terricaulis silvestris]
MTDLKPADALAQHWTDALPRAWKPFAQLSRLDRPIGWQLLLLPCWMGIAVSRTGFGFFWSDLALAFAFLVGAIAMRGAGCTYNDILDRDIDAQVERTRARPLPSGAVTTRGAWVWLIAQCLVGLGVLVLLPRTAQIVASIAVPFVALYPLMKRITWWPQAWLGIVFSWGALVGGAAVSYLPGVPFEAIALYAGCICWTIGYDTIYALQDREDDVLVGVRSTARLFADKWRMWTSVFYVAAVALWTAAAAIAGSSVLMAASLSMIGAAMIWPMLESVDDARPETALAAFKRNAMIGAAVLLAFALEPIWRTVRPILGV